MNDYLESRIDYLQGDNDRLREDNDRLREENEKLKQENKELKDIIVHYNNFEEGKKRLEGMLKGEDKSDF